MFRFVTLLATGLLTPTSMGAAGPDKPGEAVRQEQARFQGTWKVVSVKNLLAPDQVAQRKGKEWVAGPGLEAAQSRRVEGVYFIFKDGRLTIRKPKDGPRHFPYAFDEASYKLDLSPTPKAIAFTPVADKRPKKDRRPYAAIYLLDGKELWICDFEGNSVRPDDFSMGVGIAYPKRIFVLRRVEDAKAVR